MTVPTSPALGGDRDEEDNGNWEGKGHRQREALSRRNSVCLILTLLFLVFSASLLSSQVTGILHAFHDPDTTDALHGFCVTSGTVACPSFHFYLATSGNVAVYDAKVDFVLIEELTDAHLPQRWLWDGEHLPDPYSCYAFCTRLPQGQVGAVQCLWVSEWWVGLVMHNADYRVTVQWRYWEFVMRSDDPIDAELIEHGPFQTSITINVQNLVATSPDETKVLKWDPVRGIADTSFSYGLECAQRKWCQVKVSIYTTDGMKVYEEWLEQIAPGSYGFVWDGSVNVVPPPPPPDGKAPAGLYVFDIEVIGIAPGYDEDRIRSEALYVGEHEVYFLAYGNDVQSSYSVPASGHVQAWYLLRGAYQASQALVEVYDPNFQKVISVSGTTKTISETALPRPEDWNIVDFSLSTSEPASFYPYNFLFWAWDGCWTYKNHRPKTTFNNWRLRSYTAAHFMAPSSFQLTSHQKAVKELRDVRFWRWHQQLRRYVPMRRDYGEHWWWTDPANTAPPNSPTNSPSLHKEPCALNWNTNLIFVDPYTGEVYGFGYKYMPMTLTNLTPNFSADEAKARIEQAFRNLGAAQVVAVMSVPEDIFLDAVDGLVIGATQTSGLRLAYVFDKVITTGAPGHEDEFGDTDHPALWRAAIDAHTGELFYREYWMGSTDEKDKQILRSNRPFLPFNIARKNTTLLLSALGLIVLGMLLALVVFYRLRETVSS